LIAFAGVQLACSTLQVPMTVPTFKPAEVLRADTTDMRLEVKPIVGVRSYWQLFDDNLPEIGIAAVWVALTNLSDGMIDFSRSKWLIQIGGRVYGRLDNSQVLDQYYKRRHIRMYTDYADRRARQKLARITFDLVSLRPSAQEDGLVFFRVNPASAPDWTRGAVLQIRNVRTAGRKSLDLNLPLAYAHP
jgi:hypothetical protein